MKVAVLLGSLNQGGTEKLVLGILYNTIKVNFDMLVIYRKEGELSEIFHSAGVQIYKVESQSKRNFLNYLYKLRKLIKCVKPDIIHTHQRIDTVYARLASLGLHVKLIQTFHDFDFHYGKLGKLLIQISLKIAYRNIFVSEYQKNYFHTAYKLGNLSSLSVVYNGIDFYKQVHPIKQSIREEFDIVDQCLVLGMVGNFNNGRDQFTICRFLDLLENQGIDFKFLFVGKKDTNNPHLFDECYYYCMNKGLSENVIFCGSRSDVPVLLPQLDAFVYSSDHDTFGIAVIEAIASGIPVFVNDWKVIKEITDNGVRAILYETRNEYDLLEKFLYYYIHPEKYQEKIKENSLWARDTFNIQKHLLKLTTIYSEVASV